MFSMLTLTGYLIADPVYDDTAGPTPRRVCTFTIPERKKRGNSEVTLFRTVKVYGQAAAGHEARNLLKKGSMVQVIGTEDITAYFKDGVAHPSVIVHADRLIPLEYDPAARKSKAGKSGANDVQDAAELPSGNGNGNGNGHQESAEEGEKNVVYF